MFPINNEAYKDLAETQKRAKSRVDVVLLFIKWPETHPIFKILFAKTLLMPALCILF